MSTSCLACSPPRSRHCWARLLLPQVRAPKRSANFNREWRVFSSASLAELRTRGQNSAKTDALILTYAGKSTFSHASPNRCKALTVAFAMLLPAAFAISSMCWTLTSSAISPFLSKLGRQQTHPMAVIKPTSQSSMRASVASRTHCAVILQQAVVVRSCLPPLAWLPLSYLSKLAQCNVFAWEARFGL